MFGFSLVHSVDIVFTLMKQAQVAHNVRVTDSGILTTMELSHEQPARWHRCCSCRMHNLLCAPRHADSMGDRM